VKLSAIALDYDGTIANEGTLDRSVREAIADARTSGIVVLLVTGRMLDELRRVAGDLHFVDGVVAENGAVVHFPATGHTAVLAPVMSPVFVEEIARRGVPFSVGTCLVDADAGQAGTLLEVIRALQMPLVLQFNKGRVMTVPQGVSKATGLEAALGTLRLSARNTLAIGDAENDHELLRIAEVGVAVAWGSPSLCAVADVTLAGSGPPAVAGYLRTLTAAGTLPVPSRARRRLSLGYTEDGAEFSLAVLGRNVLVAGDPNSGKSWVAGLLCEQLILQGYCVCVIDPEGDYRSLERLPGVAVLGGDDPPPTPRDLLRALRYPDRSVVIDLSQQPHDEKIEQVRGLLAALKVLHLRTGLPHRILVDEAHYYLHDEDARELLDMEQHGYTVVTYRASRLPAALLAATEVMIVTCESDPDEIEALRARCAGGAHDDPARWASLLGRLKPGQAVALPITDETSGTLRMFTLGPRLTPHVRHREKYVDVPVSEPRAFIVASDDGESPRVARTLRQFVDVLTATPGSVITPYLVRGDCSRWVREVFGDHALAGELEVLEARHRASPDSDIVREIAAAIRGRYDLAGDRSPLPVERASVSGA
jgi:hydroxymethylpyrimidine pyrophosphatase-like HAD family hydrolase